MGALTTHVLDTALGKPAEGLDILLFRVTGNSHRKIGEFVTNSDGRVDNPLLSGDDFQIGEYELIFKAGDYLDRSGATVTDPKFLDQIPIRFAISDDSHYHVPLLLSAHGYSTYRGS